MLALVITHNKYTHIITEMLSALFTTMQDGMSTLLPHPDSEAQTMQPARGTQALESQGCASPHTAAPKHQRSLSRQVCTHDPDRVRTRLQEDLRRVQEAGGAGTWEFFRALGRAKAALAGKRTQPKDGRPGMSAIKLTESH